GGAGAPRAALTPREPPPGPPPPPMPCPKSADYSAPGRRYPPLTDDQEARLAARIRRGDRAARERLILSNVRLALHYVRQHAHWGERLPAEDAVQMALLGLMTAADRYDPAKASFATYAWWWMRPASQRG